MTERDAFGLMNAGWNPKIRLSSMAFVRNTFTDLMGLMFRHFANFLLGFGFLVQLWNVGPILAEQPNILMIVTDDQGWADIGYNNENVYSPNLDRLAKEGLLFRNHYVMPQCTPTRVALMTGRYPSRFGGAALAASNVPAFPIGTSTIASMLQSRGYSTYLCGKWHLGSSLDHGPAQFGFDHSYGSMAGAVGMYDHRYRKGKFYESWHRDQKLIQGSENGTHATDLLAQECIRIIRQPRTKPFFLYVPFQSVHTPLDERGEFVNQPTQLDPDNPGRWKNESKIPWFNDPDGKIQSEKDPEKRLLLAAVHHLDSAIGDIIQAVEDTGQREKTLILFSSDNGPQGSWPGNAYPNDLKLTNFNQPLPMRGKKVDVWEGGIHVPGFANWQGKIQPGETDQLMHIVDWFPTLAKLVDYQPKAEIEWDGIDLSPVLFSGQSLPPRELYWTWRNPINRWAFRFENWKLVRYGKEEPVSPEDWQLFNLDTDPEEKNDIGSSNPDQRERLHFRFLKQRSRDAQKSKR